MVSPESRPVQLLEFGNVVEFPEGGNLHYYYERLAAQYRTF